MRLKSYFAQSIGDALESARLELGPEAMLLNSRKASAEQNHLGEFEVVFGVAGNSPAQKKPQAQAERQVAAKQTASKRIFPNLNVPEVSESFPEVETYVPSVSSRAAAAGSKRIFPDLIAPEPAQRATSTMEASVPRTSSNKRIFPELLTRPESSEPELQEIETTPTAWLAEMKQVASELAESEPEDPVAYEIETPVATKPLFPKTQIQASKPAVAEVPVPTLVPEVATPVVAQKQLDVLQSEDLAHELAELRKQLKAVTQSLSEGLEARWNAPPKGSVVDHLFSRLTAFDFSEEFSKDLIGSAAQSKMSEYESILRNAKGAAASTAAPSSKAILNQLKSRFTVDSEISKAGADRRVVLFVGPPGAGKTTSLVKLAVQLGLEQELPVQLLSLDTFRVAGSEQLNAFGRILGVGFTALHTTDDLAEALEAHQDKKLILIDTPGYAAADGEEIAQIAAFFSNHREVEVQLVLPATARLSALRKFVARFSPFQPSKLIYTRLDEVDTLGPVMENTIAASLPISFLADGQSIPQDLHEATKDRLLEGLFANARAAAPSAA